MQTKYTLKMPGVVYSGEGALANIGQIIRAGNYKAPALFTDEGIVQSGLLQMVQNELKPLQLACEVYDELPAEPSYTAVQQVADAFRRRKSDFVIACGGGSVMDTAKLVAVLAGGDYSVKDLLDNPSLARKGLPTLLIPTTAGTGAEATSNAIVAVPEKELKVGIVSDAMMADYVILDARLTRNMPGPIAAATGVDALCHAVECYTSKKANPFSDTFALAACDLILNNIRPACNDKDDMQAKSNMLIGSFYGGVAITASGTTGVHALSYPLGGKYHIAHGVSNAMLLCPVMRYNQPAIGARLAEIYDRCRHGEKSCMTQQEKSDFMIRWLEEIVQELAIPTSLGHFDVPPGDVDDLVKAGMQVTRLLVNNAREITPEAAREIYSCIL